MTTYNTTLRDPGLIPWRRFCRNGRVVSGMLESTLREATNHCVAYRRKSVFKGVPLSSVATSGSSGDALFATTFRTGYGATQIAARILAVPVPSAITIDPYFDIQITDGYTGGSTTTGSEFHAPMAPNGSSTITPDNFVTGVVTVDCSENTVYRIWIRGNNARIVGACFYELGTVPVDTANGGTLDLGIHANSPILDKDVGNLRDAHQELFARNGAVLFWWSADNHGTSNRTITGTTYTNVFDATTTVTANTVGMVVDTDYLGSYSTGPKVVIAVNANIVAPGAANGSFKVTDGTNNYEITGINSAGIYTTTATLPVGNAQKFDFYAKAGAGGETIDIDEINVFLED